MVVGISLTGLCVAGKTQAYFSDAEISGNNTFQVSTLDFSLSGADFSPEVTPSQNTSRTIDIGNDGSLDFDYAVKSDNVLGDLCSSLNLSATLGGYTYTGLISGFIYSAGQFGTVGGNWQFEINLPSNDLSLQNETCTFDFVFDGSQIGGVGFSDQETISNTVNSGTWTNTPPPASVPVPDIVLNELLPNPSGADTDVMPNGEWVELYNNTDSSIDLSGYYLKDGNNHRVDVESCRIMGGSTVIPSHGFLVVYRKGGIGCTASNFSMNDAGDTVTLYDSSDTVLDSHTYIGSSVDKSIARSPDGMGPWHDPIPTPGAPNILEETVSVGVIVLTEEVIPTEVVVLTEEVVPTEVVVLTEEVVVEEVIEEPVLEEETQAAEEPAIEQVSAVESEPVVESVDNSGGNSGEDSSVSSEAPVAE